MTALRNSRVIAAGIGAAYLLLYLVMLRDLSFGGQYGWGVRAAHDWLGLMVQARGLFQFEGIAMVEAGVVNLIISPLNILIGAVLGALVAVNVHGVIELRRAPPACGIGGTTRTGVLASLPALLAGGACCAPALLLLVGIPSLGALAGLFGWLIPLSMALLAASRWWQRRLGAPGWVRGARSAHRHGRRSVDLPRLQGKGPRA